MAFLVLWGWTKEAVRGRSRDLGLGKLPVKFWIQCGIPQVGMALLMMISTVGLQARTKILVDLKPLRIIRLSDKQRQSHKWVGPVHRRSRMRHPEIPSLLLLYGVPL